MDTFDYYTRCERYQSPLPFEHTSCVTEDASFQEKTHGRPTAILGLILTNPVVVLPDRVEI